MTLQAEIETAAAKINTDAYAMSIGEVINLYRDQELIIRPAFQRLFRWSVYQKSRLIESILLGIPIPSIFVSQRDDGVWEVVDGLQRLSTILEFVGELRGADGAQLAASTLVGTTYLPSLEDRTFDTGAKPLEPGQRIAFKRAKLDVKIVKEAEEATTKYDLFDRLNSGGSNLSDQEFRNSLIVMSNPDFMDWLEGLRQLSDYQGAVAPSEKQSEEQYDLELVVRWLVLMNSSENTLTQFKDLRELLTREIIRYAEDPAFSRQDNEDVFQSTFGILNSSLGASTFKRYDEATARFLGKFSVSSFEVVSVGIASHLDIWRAATAEQITAKVRSIWSDEDFKRFAGGGINPTTRIPRTVALGRRLFASVD